MISMTELMDSLARLRQQRLPGLELGDDFQYPAYNGHSILNLPGSICRLMGLPDFGAPPLAEDILERLRANGDYQRVILILMDALALHRLRRWMEEGCLPTWERLAQDGLLAPLTSITPSTTSAALTSLWTGRPTAEHGIVGYEMWLKEYGIVANTILHSPATFSDGVGSLALAGFDPQTFMPLPTLGSHLAASGVKAHAFQHYSIIRSGLSKMFFNDVETHGFISAADLWVSLRQMLEAQPGARYYTWVYWSEVDTFSHRYGPDDERASAEFIQFTQAMEQNFLAKLSPAERKGTLLALSADHGAIETPPDPYYDLRNHPALTRRLHMAPSGEHRFTYLYVRPGQMEAVREYIERTWPNQFAVVDPLYAASAGLFGPGEQHPRLAERVGDLLLIARGQAYLWWEHKENHMHGRHGGLHPEEMLVPFLAAAL
jgi:predicted AlkP superfamily pyrophosphatase or phosphodiesterase